MSFVGYWAVELALYWYALKGRREALMVLVFSLPLSRRLPALPLPLLNYQNIIFLLVLFVCLRDIGKEKSPGMGIRHWVPLGILTILFTVSYANTALFFTPDFYPRLWDPYKNMMVYRALIMCFAMYATVSYFIRSRGDLLAVVRAGVAGILVEAGYTSFEFLVLRPGRVSGHLAEPNSMGCYLAGSFALVFALMILLPRVYPQWKLVFASVGVAGVGLLGTMSRGAWLAGLAGFAVVSTWVSRLALLAGIGVLALGSLWLPERVMERLDATFISADDENWKFKDGRGTDESALLSMINSSVTDGGMGGERLDTSMQSRLVVWEAAGKMMAEYPLGVGLSAFPWYIHHYTSVIRWKAAHNIYLKVGAEAGLMTLMIFLALIIFLCRDAIRAGLMKDDVEMRAFGVGMLGYICALSVSALGVDVFFQVDVNGQFWCLAAAVSQAALYPADSKAPRVVPQNSPAGPKPLYELVS